MTRLAFDTFLRDRLETLAPQVRRVLDDVDPRSLPADADLLHIEIFEEPMYEMRLFAFRADGAEAFGDPETWAPSPALAAANAALDALQPIVSAEELDRFLRWEDDPKWGRQVTLEQPLDSYDAWTRLGPFLADVTEGLRQRFDGDFTAGMHDAPRRKLSEPAR